MTRIIHQLVFVVYLQTIHGAIMRNNALMSKMVNQFQDKGNQNQNQNLQPQTKDNVVDLMQKVLCKNFPTIPCSIIVKDPTLRNLIEKSIQQIKYKKMTIDRTTSPPNFALTLFPVINSEDLSNFLQESNTLYKENETQQQKKQKRNQRQGEPSEKKTKKKKKGKNSTLHGRKKIRKFYPHKIKYKDKNVKNDFGDYSGEKLSMSVELPEPAGVKRRHFTYRNPDPPVWRIDYMKHGDPPGIFNYESGLKGKMLNVRTGPNVIVDDHILEQGEGRKDVLHPDVYIKRNYIRRSTANAEHPENMEQLN